MKKITIIFLILCIIPINCFVMAANPEPEGDTSGPGSALGLGDLSKYATTQRNIHKI